MAQLELLRRSSEIRSLLERSESPYQTSEERDRNLGEALRLLCQDLGQLANDLPAWHGVSRGARLLRQLRPIAEELAADAHLDHALESLIGPALDREGWPGPPSAGDELSRLRRELDHAAARGRPVLEDSDLTRALSGAAGKACDLEGAFRGEFESRRLNEEKRGKYRRGARLLYGIFMTALALVGGVSDVPNAYDQLSEKGAAAYHYVLSNQVIQQTEAPEVMDISEASRGE